MSQGVEHLQVQLEEQRHKFHELEDKLLATRRVLSLHLPGQPQQPSDPTPQYREMEGELEFTLDEETLRHSSMTDLS